jgi:hypothetical protein
VKKLFYFTDILPFLSKPEIAIDKLLRNLELFKDSSENIRLIWHPWSHTEEYLRLNKCPVTDRYLEIVEDYKAAGWGTLDETKSPHDARKVLMGCDAYYGDFCELVFYAKENGIPAMIRNVEIG